MIQYLILPSPNSYTYFDDLKILLPLQVDTYVVISIFSNTKVLIYKYTKILIFGRVLLCATVTLSTAGHTAHCSYRRILTVFI